MPLVLGVGSDVSGTSVEVRDADTGRLVGAGRSEHAAPVDGSQHPEVWWDGMVDAIAAAELRHEVAGVAIAGQRQALVLLDGAGAPVLPASLRDDAVAVRSAASLVDRLGADKLARSTGQVPGAETPLVRLAALVAADASLLDRCAALLGATEQLTYRLTGRLAADRGSASGTGWFAPVSDRWLVELLDRAVRTTPAGGWDRLLADLVGPGEAADRVRATVHRLLGLKGRPLVAVGTDDLMARALAAAIAPGAVAALLDADSVVVGLTEAPAADAEGVLQSFADATGRHLPTVATLSVGPVLEAAGRLLGTDGEGLASLAAAAAKAGGRPDAAPVVVGFQRNAPGGRPRPRPGAVLALGPEHGPGDLALAALHGVAHDILLGVDRQRRAGNEGPLVLAGAHATWPGLATAVADLSGDEVIVGPGATPAAGACLLAAAVVRGERDPLVVAAEWGFDDGTAVEPTGSIDGPATRAAITAARAKVMERA